MGILHNTILSYKQYRVKGKGAKTLIKYRKIKQNPRGTKLYASGIALSTYFNFTSTKPNGWSDTPITLELEL